MTDEVRRVREAVDRHRELAFRIHDEIWAHPETGYREWNTSRLLEAEYEKLGYTLMKAGDVPGFYTDLETGRPGPKLLIMGELDSLICVAHPEADPETHAVHACGHSAQSAALLALAAALKEPGILDGLCGSIRLMAVPAEELIEIGFRESLRKKGIIHYMGGKVEFMYRGYMDGCDLAFMLHTTSGEGDFRTTRGSNGCISKEIIFTGKAAHAGGSPDKGINALYAANLGMNAVNALRETFPDNDHIRVHPIMTKGGDAVNAIPAEVRVESYVRGSSMEAIVRENRKVNRAFAGAALAMGANAEIIDRSGYHPLKNDPNLLKACEDAMEELSGPEKVNKSGAWATGSTDMGDVAAVMPAIHPYACGACGTGHGADYYVKDKERAVLNSARLQLLLAIRLLENDAALAREIVAKKSPAFPSKEAYFRFMDTIEQNTTAVSYAEDGSAEVRWVKEPKQR